MDATRTGETGTLRRTDAPPDGAVRAVARSTARIGLVSRDGLISTLSRRLTCDLGFDGPEDLSGLSLGSLWHPADRAAVQRAFADALRGRTGGAEVDMGYVRSDAGPARVTFAPGQPGSGVLMTFDWGDPGDA